MWVLKSQGWRPESWSVLSYDYSPFGGKTPFQNGSDNIVLAFCCGAILNAEYYGTRYTRILNLTIACLVKKVV